MMHLHRTRRIYRMKYTPYLMKDVHEASSQEKFTVISTFAGGGGSSTGYRLAGGKILAVNEFVEEAQRTYAENYPDTPILPDDIKKITGKDLMDAAGVKPGELDILMVLVVNIQMVGVLLKTIQMVRKLKILKTYSLNFYELLKKLNLKSLLQRMWLV